MFLSKKRGRSFYSNLPLICLNLLTLRPKISKICKMTKNIDKSVCLKQSALRNEVLFKLQKIFNRTYLFLIRLGCTHRLALINILALCNRNPSFQKKKKKKKK